MADLTNVESTLAEVLGLAMAAKGMTEHGAKHWSATRMGTGLEPGTPRFSDRGTKPSNSNERPANKAISADVLRHDMCANRASM
jgi:hypothetical protein